MNFKFTRGKSITSIIGGLVGGFYLYQNFAVCIGICSPNINSIRTKAFIFGALIIFGLVYLIWSLFQKKK